MFGGENSEYRNIKGRHFPLYSYIKVEFTHKIIQAGGRNIQAMFELIFLTILSFIF